MDLGGQDEVLQEALVADPPSPAETIDLHDLQGLYDLPGFPDLPGLHDLPGFHNLHDLQGVIPGLASMNLSEPALGQNERAVLPPWPSTETRLSEVLEWYTRSQTTHFRVVWQEMFAEHYTDTGSAIYQCRGFVNGVASDNLELAWVHANAGWTVFQAVRCPRWAGYSKLWKFWL